MKNRQLVIAGEQAGCIQACMHAREQVAEHAHAHTCARAQSSVRIKHVIGVRQFTDLCDLFDCDIDLM